MTPIGKVGCIIKGEHPGWYVLVEDDTAKTGGYYIYICKRQNIKEPRPGEEGYDYWVEHQEDVEHFFSNWIVQWNE
jgi:hypothetical protein